MRDNRGRFVKGILPWNKGNIGWLKHTDEAKEKIRQAHLGRKFTEEHKRKIGDANRERIWKESSRIKVGKGGKLRTGNNNGSWKGGFSSTKDYIVIKSNERRIRKLNAKGTHSLQEWQELKEKYNSMCLCCKKFEPKIQLTEDHIIPLIMDGTDYIDNIQPLCISCNSIKNKKTIDYRERRT